MVQRIKMRGVLHAPVTLRFTTVSGTGAGPEDFNTHIVRITTPYAPTRRDIINSLKIAGESIDKMLEDDNMTRHDAFGLQVIYPQPFEEYCA